VTLSLRTLHGHFTQNVVVLLQVYSGKSAQNFVRMLSDLSFLSRIVSVLLFFWTRCRNENYQHNDTIVTKDYFLKIHRKSMKGSSMISPSQFQTLVVLLRSCSCRSELIRTSEEDSTKSSPPPTANSSNADVGRKRKRDTRNVWMNGKSNCKRQPGINYNPVAVDSYLLPTSKSRDTKTGTKIKNPAPIRFRYWTLI